MKDNDIMRISRLAAILTQLQTQNVSVGQNPENSSNKIKV